MLDASWDYYAVGSTLHPHANGKAAARRGPTKFSPHIRIVGRTIRYLPGIRVHTDVNPPRGRGGAVLLLVQEGNQEDRLWAKETGRALMASGRAAWVVEIRDHELLPDDSPRHIQEALHAHALLWPEWQLAYGSGLPDQRELAEVFVEYCRKRGRWGDPVIIEALYGCDDLYSICTGSPVGAFRALFFKVKAEKEEEEDYDGGEA